MTHPTPINDWRVHKNSKCNLLYIHNNVPTQRNLYPNKNISIAELIYY